MNRVLHIATALLTAAFLAGCGADGEPLQPQPKVSASTTIGVNSGSGGFVSNSVGIHLEL